MAANFGYQGLVKLMKILGQNVSKIQYLMISSHSKITQNLVLSITS